MHGGGELLLDGLGFLDVSFVQEKASEQEREVQKEERLVPDLFALEDTLNLLVTELLLSPQVPGTDKAEEHPGM